jgi:peroxiredoxin
VRATRFSMVVDDGTVTHLNIEESPAEMTVSGADTILEQV